jgi:hypothetical protein
MAIGNKAAEKQNGHSGFSAVAAFQSKGEGLCRLHHNPVVEAPVRVATLAGAMIRTAEAARALNSSIRLSTVKLNRRFHNGRTSAECGFRRMLLFSRLILRLY